MNVYKTKIYAFMGAILLQLLFTSAELKLQTDKWVTVEMNWRAICFVEYKDYMWVGCSDTAYKLKKSTLQIEDTVKRNMTYQLVVDKRGDLWFSGTGISKYDGEKVTSYNQKIQGILLGDTYSAIDSSGILWFSNDIGVVSILSFDGSKWNIYDTSNTPVTKKMKDYNHDPAMIAVDKLNTKWFILNSYGLLKFNGTDWKIFDTTNTGMPINFISGISTDQQNNIWATTFWKGLLKFDGISQWTKYDTSNTCCIYTNYWPTVDSSGNLWFINEYKGKTSLYRFDGENFEDFSLDNFKEMGIFRLYIDSKQNKWLGFQASNKCGFMIFNENGVALSAPEDIVQTSKPPQIYPNPAKNSLNIEGIESAFEYIIYDITGKACLNGTCYNNIININNLRQAVYYINIKNLNHTHNLMFIKE